MREKLAVYHEESEKNIEPRVKALSRVIETEAQRVEKYKEEAAKLALETPVGKIVGAYAANVRIKPGTVLSSVHKYRIFPQ